MKTRYRFLSYRLAVFTIFLFILTDCSPVSGPALFIPPTEAAKPIPNIPIILTSTPGLIPTTIMLTPLPACLDNLTFVQDLTFPDGAMVTPGQLMDKEWLLTNSGTCNWDLEYRLKLISGDPMGAMKEQALYPARAGTNATLHILFTAPSAPGIYKSAWQAFNSKGQAIGEPIYIQIMVSP